MGIRTRLQKKNVILKISHKTTLQSIPIINPAIPHGQEFIPNEFGPNGHLVIVMSFFLTKRSKYVILPDISLTGRVWVPGAVWFAWAWDVCPYETVELAERARRRKGTIARYSRTPTGSLGRLARLVFNAPRLVCPSTVGLNKSKIDFIFSIQSQSLVLSNYLA